MKAIGGHEMNFEIVWSNPMENLAVKATIAVTTTNIMINSNFGLIK